MFRRFFAGLADRKWSKKSSPEEPPPGHAADRGIEWIDREFPRETVLDIRALVERFLGRERPNLHLLHNPESDALSQQRRDRVGNQTMDVRGVRRRRPAARRFSRHLRHRHEPSLRHRARRPWCPARRASSTAPAAPSTSYQHRIEALQLQPQLRSHRFSHRLRRLETKPLPPQIQCPRSLPAFPAARRPGGLRKSRPLASILGEFAFIKYRILSLNARKRRSLTDPKPAHLHAPIEPKENLRAHQVSGLRSAVAKLSLPVRIHEDVYHIKV